MTELIQKLIEVQGELKAPKNQFNNFGKYSYRSVEDILEAVKPLNKKHGLLLTLSDELVLIGDRYYIKATATLTDGQKSIVTTSEAREALNKKGMDESQITGSTSSYARKYALNGMYLIDDNKDADTNEYNQQGNNNQQANNRQANNNRQWNKPANNNDKQWNNGTNNKQASNANNRQATNKSNNSAQNQKVDDGLVQQISNLYGTLNTLGWSNTDIGGYVKEKMKVAPSQADKKQLIDTLTALRYDVQLQQQGE